jgi:hypothetical protein
MARERPHVQGTQRGIASPDAQTSQSTWEGSLSVNNAKRRLPFTTDQTVGSPT